MEQASLAVFTAVICFAVSKYNLIKFKLYNNWSEQTVNNILESAMASSSKPIKFAHL